MGFSRQEYWNGLPFPTPGYLPNPGIEPRSPALQADSLPTELQGKPHPDQCSNQVSDPVRVCSGEREAHEEEPRRSLDCENGLHLLQQLLPLSEEESQPLRFQDVIISHAKEAQFC